MHTARRCCAASPLLREWLIVRRGCGHHRDLHSFPTRRSSDLVGGESVPVSTEVKVTDPAAPGAIDIGSVRSEEHTSELQSHSDLVCRLLLEKKNRPERARPVRAGRRCGTLGRAPRWSGILSFE